MATSFTYPCMIFRQRESTDSPRFCLFVATVGEILKWSDIKRLSEEAGAPQRAVNKAKLLSVRRFLELDPRNSIPSGVIVNLKLPAKAFKSMGE